MDTSGKNQTFLNYFGVMKNLSIIAVLTAFFVCAIALGAHARDVEKITQPGQILIEVSNETEDRHGFDVPNIKAEKERLPAECTVFAIKECEDGGSVIAVGSGETCAEAAATAGAAADDTPCPKDLPPLQSA